MAVIYEYSAEIDNKDIKRTQFWFEDNMTNFSKQTPTIVYSWCWSNQQVC